MYGVEITLRIINKTILKLIKVRLKQKKRPVSFQRASHILTSCLLVLSPSLPFIHKTSQIINLHFFNCKLFDCIAFFLVKLNMRHLF